MGNKRTYIQTPAAKALCVKAFSVLAAALLILCTASCHRRPLMDAVNERYIRVYLNTDIQNVTSGLVGQDTVIVYADSVENGRTRAADGDVNLESIDDFKDYKHPELVLPTALVALFCDTLTGNVVVERFLRHSATDSIGLYYDGTVLLPPGDYYLLVYNFGVESTTIFEERNYFKARAVKNTLSPFISEQLPPMSSEEGRRVYTPDLLFVGSARLTANLSFKVDTLLGNYHSHFFAESLVKYYFIQLKVKGFNSTSIAKVSGLLSGVVGGVNLCDGTLTQEDVNLYFDMEHTPAVDGEVLIYVTFPAFGYVPGKANDLQLLIGVETTDGRKVVTELDITEEIIENPDHRQIFLETEIEIPAPTGPSGGDGFTPQVIDWKDVETDIYI